MPSPPEDPKSEPPSGAAPGIPDEAEGTPVFEGRELEGDGTPVADLPQRDFWDALYSRRSIRKFTSQPVPRELVDQVMHAGIWAPSSCNYQMWDLVAVDDPEINTELTALSLQMGNAPVNIVVSYGRDFSEENWANIQSASALIQNMSLAAQVLGLGTFWITQTGDAERVREIVGLPIDRMVIAVLALGYPKVLPAKGPKRRPLGQVTHYNHYAGRAIPSSVDPEDWAPDLLAIYQRARVLNGLRHNKPRPWEVRALTSALDVLVPEGREKSEGEPLRWLDVLPCTGILTDRLSRERGGFTFDVVERSPEVAAFCAGSYDVVSCLFRLEDLARADRSVLVGDIVRWLKPGGALLLGFVNKRSFHDLTERLRKRRGGPRGVEYLLAPDPNIGPFEPLDPDEITTLFEDAGFHAKGQLGLQAAPQHEEIEFRTRNFSKRSRGLARAMGKALTLVEKIPGVQSRLGRFQFVRFER